MNALSPPPLREDLRIAAVLGAAAAVATALLFPYLLQTMPETLAKLRLPLAIVVPVQALQAGVLMTLLSLLGLRMGHRARLDAPWLRAWLTGRVRGDLPWRIAVASGIGAAGLVILASALTDPHLPERLQPHAAATPSANALAGFLASFYGGIAEELQLRLFLMTLLVWTVARLRGQPPAAGWYWSALAIAALMFGLGHLPAAAKIWPLDAIVVTRTLLLNGLAGLVFGWLYWRRGLEAAMLAHFCADLVLHVATPLVAGAMA